MTARLAIKRNIVWNSAGLVIETATGFLVLPFLISKLGTSSYGIWLVLVALTSYFGLLELGVRGAIGRHIALHHSQGDRVAMSQTLTGGLIALLSGGTVVCSLLLLLEPFFLRFYEIPEEHGALVSTAFRIVALNFVVVLLGTVFDAALWGIQRFDCLNAVDIPVSLGRLFATFALIRSSNDLVVLALITLTMSSLNLLSKAAIFFYLKPYCRISATYLTLQSIGKLLKYGSWNLISTLARLSRTQLGPILIGSFLGLTFVPLFSAVNRMLSAAASAINSVTGVLTPHATALHATNQIERQRELFLTGGRHAAVLGVFTTSALLALGEPLLTLWVGFKFSATEISTAAALLITLALGEILPSTQYVTISIILATARHRALAFFATLETVAVCGLMAVLLPLLGLLGVGIAVAIPALFTRGVAPMIHGCRILGVPLRQYMKQTLLPPFLCAIPPTLLVRLLLTSYPISSWWSLLGISAVYAILFGVSYICVLDRKWPTRTFQSMLTYKRLKSHIDQESTHTKIGSEKMGSEPREPSTR